MDPTALGHVGDPYEFVVELGKIRELARATFADHPDFEAGTCSPPTFAFTGRFWMDEGSDVSLRIGMDRQRSLHAEQEYVFHGPPPAAGTRLVGRSHVAEMYEKQGRRGGPLRFCVVRTEYRDESGALVAEARQVSVETSHTPQEET